MLNFAPIIKVMPYWGSLNQRKVLRKYLQNKKFGSEDSQFYAVITSYQLALGDEKFFS